MQHKYGNEKVEIKEDGTSEKGHYLALRSDTLSAALPCAYTVGCHKDRR
jgi:hypothetical protein